MDDEPEVHRITKITLNKFEFDGKPIDFLHAYSAAMPASAATPDRFEERESPVWLPWALGGGGVLLLLLGAGGFILLQKRRTLHKAMAAQKAQLEETPATPKLDLNLPEQ
ncbi:hypothetical protein BFG06_18805 [Aeromonas caviae]|nr:hypothetical protein BFG06_18805 [Aeromonas caviae]